jgi:hypothetical protein
MNRRAFALLSTTALTAILFGPLTGVNEGVQRRLVSLPVAKPAVKIECVAGCGAGFPDGSAQGARLIEPFGVAFDKQRNWYICEYKGQRISEVDSKGNITIFAGMENISQNVEGELPAN